MRLIIIALVYFLSIAVSANEIKYQDYTVYYSVFNSDFVEPKVARQHNLRRSKNLALVNITVVDNQTGKAVTANVSGNAYNLVGQARELAFKEIKEDTSVYYIANFRFSDKENFNFKLRARPDGQEKSLPIEFKQSVYISQ
ncbi:MAG: DUF4426 domain-containing protein [Kangiellaceae bacterium]|jgi:hypothetical protein|nr:DUF4426 domain-containing protein [Kangiellaceae bacterium]